MLARQDPALITMRDKDQRTALFYAVLNTNPQAQEITRRLLAEQADPNTHDANGMTALHYAAEAGNFDVVACLLRHRADPAIEDRDSGKTPVMFAAGHGTVRNELLRALSERVS